MGEFRRRGFKALSCFLLIVLSCMTIMSCDPEVVEEEIVEYGISSISGMVELPSSAGIRQSDVWVKAVGSNGNTARLQKIDVTGKFLLADMPNDVYDLYFTSSEPDFNNHQSRVIENTVSGFGTVVRGIQSLANCNDIGIVKLKALGSIKGLVTLNGVKKEGIDIFIPGTSFITKTDSTGSFILTDIPSGTFDLVVEYPGYVTEIFKGARLISSDGNKAPSVVIPEIRMKRKSGSVEGTVYLSGSSVLVGTYITLEDKVSQNTQSVETDMQGRFIFPSVEPGNYSILVSRNRYISHRVDDINVVAGVTTSIDELLLKKLSSSVSGTVLLSGSEIHSDITLELTSFDGLRHYFSVTDANGSFRFDDVVSGSYVLIISSAGYDSITEADVDIVGSDSFNIGTRVLEKAETAISGYVYPQFKTDYSGVRVTAVNIVSPDKEYVALSNSKGKYTLSGIPAGEYLISLSYPGYDDVVLETVEIGSTECILDDVELVSSKGFISGVVSLEGRSDYSGVTVELLGTQYSTTTMKNGTYELAVPAGTYTGGLRFTHDHYGIRGYRESFVVEDGKTIGVEDVELEAKYVDVLGVVVLEGVSSNEGVKIALAGSEVITESDGSFEFVKVPLGIHSISITKDNVPSIKRQINVVPSESLDLGVLRMRPDSGTVYGYVSLDGMESSKGINVIAFTEGGKESITTITDIDGYFSISNLAVPGIHKITFSKEGWDRGPAVVIDDLGLLEERNITDSNIILYDTQSPVIDSILLNNGNSTTSFADVSLRIKATENGSGIEFMNISFTEDFSEYGWIQFENEYQVSFPDAINEDKTVYVKVKDRAGNVSEVKSATIRLTDQITEVGGTLNPSELHWTNDRNPYVVTSDITVPSGSTLIIEPGVEVYFKGNYSFYIYGDMIADGTPEQKITFRKAGNNLPSQYGEYAGNWNQLYFQNTNLNVQIDRYDCIYQSGSILRNCVIEDLSNGIKGRVFIEDTMITSSGYALGDGSEWFRGFVKDSDITGKIYAQAYSDNELFYGSIFRDNERSDYNNDCYINNISLVNNLFDGYDNAYVYCYNYNSLIRNNTFKDFTLSTWNSFQASRIENNDFSGINGIIRGSNSDVKANFNNFGDFDSSCVLYIDGSNQDWRYNYWGNQRTNELDRFDNPNNSNASFITDAHDNGWGGYADWSEYSSVAWPFAGYKGENLIIADSRLDREVPVKAPIPIVLAEGQTSYRWSSDISTILNKPWNEYKDVFYVNVNNIDEFHMDDSGRIEIFIQGRTSDGFETAIETLKVPYRAPRVYYNNYSNDYVFSGNEYVGLYLDVNTPYSSHTISYELDGVPYGDSYFYTYDLKNGRHECRFIAEDNVGNVGEYVFNFTIDRALPTFSVEGFTPDSQLNVGDALSFNICIENAEYLRHFKVYSDDVVISSSDYNDNYSSIRYIEVYLPHACIPLGNHTISIVMEDQAGNIVSKELGVIYALGTPASPTITGIGIEDGATFSGTDILEQTLTCEDEGGVRSIEIYLNDELLHENHSNTYDDARISIDTVFSIDFTKLVNGEYEMKMVATDYTGLSTTEMIHFSVIKKLPVLNNVFTVDQDKVVVSGSVKNAENLRYLNIYLDGCLMKSYVDGNDSLSGTEFNYHQEYMKTDIPLGNHVLIVEAVDRYGNEVNSEPYGLKILGYPDYSYGKGITWNVNGSLKADGNTKVLFNFDKPEHVDFETVSNENWNFSCSHSMDGIGNGSGMNINSSFYRTVDLNSDKWTLEFWINGSDRRNGSGSFCFNSFAYVGFNRNYSENAEVIDGYINGYDQWNSYTSCSYENIYLPKSYIGHWHHIAYVYDGSRFCVFMDGLKMREMENFTPDIDIREFNFNMYDGFQVDELRISDKARSQNELFDYVQYVRELKGW